MWSQTVCAHLHVLYFSLCGVGARRGAFQELEGLRPLLDSDKVLSSILCPLGLCGLHLATAPPEGRAARLAKQTLGRARISWTGWRPGARRPRRWPSTGYAAGVRIPGSARARPLVQLPRIRHLLRGLEAAGIPPPRPRVPLRPGPRGGVAHLSSETPHVGRPGWGAGVEGREKRRRRRGRWE